MIALDPEQVVVSGQSRHKQCFEEDALGSEAQGSKINQNGSLVKPDRQLLIYHEYLSYLFRKLTAPNPQPQFESEVFYRDYLQVKILAFFSHESLRIPQHI